MAGQRPQRCPLLVRGPWGAAGPPPALGKKLLCYFQSQKRSGGGECELQPGSGDGQVLVCFAQPEVRQRVLQKQCHRLDVGGKELELIVTDPEGAVAAEENTFPEKSVPTKGLDATSDLQTKDDAEALQNAESSVPSSEHQEEPGTAENIAEESAETSPSVVFENMGCNSEYFIILLENISGLSDDDFTVEEIPELNVAVATFKKRIDTEEFVKKCSQHKRVRQLKISARLLELTQSIKAENLPANISTDYITMYFESGRSGGKSVSNVQLFPEENSAIVTFHDHKDLNTVLEKQHLLEERQISVHPYYPSLGTVLYGKERPPLKMPDPVGVPLDPHVWQFLQRQANLIQDINQEMAVCHCELKWPQKDCAHPEVTLCPSLPLPELKKPVVQLIKTWKQAASAEFSRLMSHYVAIKCRVGSVGWEDVRKSLEKDVALLITDLPEETVVIAGNRAAVDRAEKVVREWMENTMKETERENQSIEISVPVVPGQYAVLQNAGLEEKIRQEYPCLKIFYDDTKKTVQLRGLPAEVYVVKADLLEKVLNIPHTLVTVDLHVLNYLQVVDNKAMSELLFTGKNINAFYERNSLRNDTVMLFGNTSKDILEAEKQIKTGLEYMCIDVGDDEVIKKEEWKNLLASSLKKHNSSQESLVIDGPVGKENKIIITGLSKTVKKVYQKFSNFLDRNIQVEKVIPAKSAIAVQFVEEKKSNVYLDLRKKGVTVCFDTKTPCIFLGGPRAEVSKAVTMFEKILSSLHSKNVTIDKPGAKNFFTERKDSHVLEAKQKFNCLIRLEEQQQQKGEAVGNKEKRKLYHEVVLPDGVIVAVYKGNLCNYPVDVVVCPSNEDLQHISGSAEALSEAAGPELQEECNELVRKNGRLQPGCVVITGAGKLPCKSVIHAVGPRWVKHEPEDCLSLIKATVKKSLQLAETYNYRSIALPAVSGGIFGFPLQTCTHSIVSSIKETLEESKLDSSLKEVHLVDDVEEVVQVLSETVKRVFTAKSFSVILRMPRSESCKMKESQEDLQVVTTNEGLCIRVEEKNIQEATTDVIVNSVGKDLKFGVGPLCKAVLEKAGIALQWEFDLEKERQEAARGSVVCTSGCALTCKSVLHAILPLWDGERGQALKTLKDIINFCLKKTEELGLKSITFPAIGTGGFGFPKYIVSKLMFDMVFEFSRTHTRKTLQEVNFCLYPTDMGNIEAFTIELGHRIAESCDATAARAGSMRPVPTEVVGVHKMRIGPIKLQVANGDITKEDTDVIVNIANEKFDAKSGVFKAIMDAAGSQVEDECAQYGQGGLNPANVADDMLDAIVEFANQRSVRNLKQIKIIVFQRAMLRDFYSSMKKRKDSDSSTKKSQLSQVRSRFLRRIQPTEKKKPKALKKKVDLATFQICGESKKKVDETESWINELISKEQFENSISDELIEDFDDSHIDTLADLQKRKDVKIQFENTLSPPLIKISGISKDVWFVSGEVQKMIQNIRDTEEEQSKAELAFNLVEWRYPGSNGSFVTFDKLTNMQLEDAKIAKKPHLAVKINNSNYKVDLNSLQATDDQGKTINIQRVPKNEDKQAIELPMHWEDMKEERVKLVNLQPSCQEYLEVERQFRKSCPTMVIEKIERMQNPYLWQTYQIKKISLCAKNKNENNERMLFHGTTASSLSNINYNGFNRAFAGKNAAAIGNGTYFAVNASYSARDTYSRPDKNNRRYMYLARVLTGQYCAGRRGLRTPPPKNPVDPFDLFDSVVDDVTNPSMFVIFNDIQAYPEYLITFKKHF
ncbi:protein mono-ADP-ribosyltransferase PARP14-like [Apus apus]|uniref:protein mono-ADP-ribosyltransferase PARP14-like n=1 Tax=Apus apus TaxID=8895 RepID=UPI0021F8C6BC|nr:protein mono-ADP-ribosyltransferase PARP14-like [Apus apus]